MLFMRRVVNFASENTTMGFLSSLMSGGAIQEGWKTLESIEDLDQALKRSNDKPVVLFKHSVTCGTSAFAKSRISELALSEDFDFYYLDLLAHRDVSNEIAGRLKVIHQSPQIIIVKDGKSVFDRSHHAISAEEVENQISAIKS